jgi:aryl-alcohol dehydrogenase-like predicted oxidoreductase
MSRADCQRPLTVRQSPSEYRLHPPGLSPGTKAGRKSRARRRGAPRLFDEIPATPPNVVAIVGSAGAFLGGLAFASHSEPQALLSAEWKVLPLAKKLNVGVMNMSPVRVKMTRPEELRRFIGRWKDAGLIARDSLPDDGPLDFLVHGPVQSVVAAGYKLGVAHDAIATVLIGTGNVRHLEENIEAVLGPPLPAEDSNRVRKLFGHIAESEGDTG